MLEFIINKEKRYHQLLIRMPNPSNYSYDTSIPPSNYPIRIINNDYGKVILAVPNGNQLINQRVLAYSNILPKHEHINFDYLSNIYKYKIDKIIAEDPLQKKKDNDYQIIIIAEGKSYLLNGDGLIMESDLLSNNEWSITLYNALYDLFKKHDQNFLEQIFIHYEKYYNYICHPLIYVDDKDFKIKFIGGN